LVPTRQQQSPVRRRVITGKSREFSVEILEAQVQLPLRRIFDEQLARLRHGGRIAGLDNRHRLRAWLKHHNALCVRMKRSPSDTAMDPIVASWSELVARTSNFGL